MIKYKLCSLEEVTIDQSKLLAFDTETDGLYGEIELAQFYQEDWDEVLLVRKPDPFTIAIMLSTVKSVMHNAHYDITCIQVNTNTRFIPASFEDTLYLSRLFYYRKEKFSLDSVLTYLLGYDPYETAGLVTKDLQDSDWSALVLTEQQLLYASIDVYYLLDLYNKVKIYNCDTSYKLDMLSVKYALDFQNNGLAVIPEVVQAQYKSNLAKIEALAVPINVNSYKQVRPYIDSSMSDDVGLATLSIQGNKRAKIVREARKLIKQNSFLNKFQPESGKIYGKFLPSARSGRFTCRDQNLEQLPRKLKKVFGYTKDADRAITYADYAQLEMRCIAAITADIRLCKLLRSGEDIHDFTAKMLFGDNPTPTQRQIAKTANFALLYGAGVKVFIEILIKQASILLDETEATKIIRRWKNLWSGIAKWQESGAQSWRAKEPWQTPMGRKYLAKRMTDQLNIKNQGFGAEVAKLAMHYIETELTDEAGMANFIHDAFIYDHPNDPDIYMPLAKHVAESMQKAWFETNRTGLGIKVRDLPMPVDVFVGWSWGCIEKEYYYKYSLTGEEYAKF